MKTLSWCAIARTLLFTGAMGWGDAQAQTIRVRVLDWMTQAPIAGAQVSVSREVSLGMGRLGLGEGAATTDAKGEASFMNLPGNESFSASREGYSAHCLGCPMLMTSAVGDLRIIHLMPAREVPVLALREEYRLATQPPSGPDTRAELQLRHFDRAKATYDREAARRQGAGMEREQAELRKFCGFAPELAAATLVDGVHKRQLEALRGYCEVSR